jgi:hypothetical protein
MPKLLKDYPAPVLETHAGIVVVRDDLIPGGTKARVLPCLFRPEIAEYIYAGPCEGYAQLALALCAARHGKRATLFSAARKVPHARTQAAIAAGAKVIGVRPGYLSVVQDRARGYAKETGALLLPFGLNTPELRGALAAVSRGIPYQPKEVWSVAGSGTLTLALQMAWPNAVFYAVRIGKAVPNVGKATLLTAPERFEEGAKEPPPFPSCDNYDAKAWQFIRQQAKPGALFWNVAA